MAWIESAPAASIFTVWEVALPAVQVSAPPIVRAPAELTKTMLKFLVDDRQIEQNETHRSSVQEW